MGAIAEGVETAEQLQFLRKLGFEGLQIQGFLLSKPLMPEHFQDKVIQSRMQNDSAVAASIKAS